MVKTAQLTGNSQINFRGHSSRDIFTCRRDAEPLDREVVGPFLSLPTYDATIHENINCICKNFLNYLVMLAKKCLC